MKQSYQTHFQSFLFEGKNAQFYSSERDLGRKGSVVEPPMFLLKQPLQTKVYDFQPRADSRLSSGKQPAFIEPQFYTEEHPIFPEQ